MTKLALVALGLSLIACVPSGIEGSNPPSPDSGNQNPTPDSPTTPVGPPCQNAVVDPGLIPDGHHFPGQNCKDACHEHGFSIGGTLLKKDLSVFPGGVITVIDANQKTIHVTAGTNGNFYTAEPLVFPLTTYASACPDVAPMISTVKEGEGGCAMGGCHTGTNTGISEVTL